MSEITKENRTKLQKVVFHWQYSFHGTITTYDIMKNGYETENWVWILFMSFSLLHKKLKPLFLPTVFWMVWYKVKIRNFKFQKFCNENHFYRNIISTNCKSSTVPALVETTSLWAVLPVCTIYWSTIINCLTVLNCLSVGPLVYRTSGLYIKAGT
jgi:hypothetical protein